MLAHGDGRYSLQPVRIRAHQEYACEGLLLYCSVRNCRRQSGAAAALVSLRTFWLAVLVQGLARPRPQAQTSVGQGRRGYSYCQALIKDHTEHVLSSPEGGEQDVEP